MMVENGGKPWPVELRVHQKGATLSITFSNGAVFDLAAEYLRVESPSAEVKGHGPGQEVTVEGKRDVKIFSLDPVGNYAVRINFSDNHSSGLYSWDYLFKLGHEHDKIWPAYLDKLEALGADRG